MKLMYQVQNLDLKVQNVKREVTKYWIVQNLGIV